MTAKSFVGSTFPAVDDMGRSAEIRLTSDEERGRRLIRLRSMMQIEGLKAIAIAGKSDVRFRGRVLYASDVFQFTADSFVVITHAGRPIFITTPVVGLGQARRTNWAEQFHVSAQPGRAIGEILAKEGITDGRVGVVGLIDAVSAIHMKELTQASPNVEFVDATDGFEHIRRVKSPEELANLQHISAVFRKIFQAMEAEIRPGVQESDIAGAAARLAKLHGCRDVKVAMATTPFNAVSYGSNKRVERDDAFMLWIETPGPSGYWLELRRSYCFGSPSKEIVEFWSLLDQVWDTALKTMRPGAAGAEIFGSVEALLSANGCRLSPSNYSLHGIGADAIEGMWYPGNDKPLLEGEVVSFHPSLVFDDATKAERISFLGMTDNVLITPEGGRRLTYDSDSIRVL
jgi:Xaa-Pro aminopeptidase